MATNYIKLEYSNSCDLGKVYYAGGFQNVIYLDTEIGAPEYQHEEDGEDNGDGVLIKTFEKLQKIYKFQVLVPEYMADALMFMALHDTITLSYTNGLYTASIRNVIVNVTWDEDTNSCMGIVDVSFQQDDQVLKDNCCTSLSA